MPSRSYSPIFFSFWAPVKLMTLIYSDCPFHTYRCWYVFRALRTLRFAITVAIHVTFVTFIIFKPMTGSTFFALINLYSFTYTPSCRRVIRAVLAFLVPPPNTICVEWTTQTFASNQV